MEFNIEHTYKPTLNVYTPGNASYIPTRKTDDCQGRLIESEKNICLHPDIEDVSISQSSSPYITTHYKNKRRSSQIHLKDLTVFMQRSEVSSSFFNIFKTSSESGSIEELEQSLSAQSIILSKEGEKMLTGVLSTLWLQQNFFLQSIFCLKHSFLPHL